MPDYCNETLLGIVSKVLEETMKITDLKVVLTVAESQLVANILNNMLTVQAKKDCSISSNFTKSLTRKTIDYLESFSRNTLRSTFPDSKAIMSLNDQFDILSQTLPFCQLDGYQINTSTEGPKVTLHLDIPSLNFSKEECDLAVNLQYYAFRPNVFECQDNENSSPKNAKSLIAFAIVDRNTKQKMNNLIRAKIYMPTGEVCPSECITIENYCLSPSLVKLKLLVKSPSYFKKEEISRLYFSSFFFSSINKK